MNKHKALAKGWKVIAKGWEQKAKELQEKLDATTSDLNAVREQLQFYTRQAYQLAEENGKLKDKLETKDKT